MVVCTRWWWAWDSHPPASKSQCLHEYGWASLWWDFACTCRLMSSLAWYGHCLQQNGRSMSADRQGSALRFKRFVRNLSTVVMRLLVWNLTVATGVLVYRSTILLHWKSPTSLSHGCKTFDTDWLSLSVTSAGSINGTPALVTTILSLTNVTWMFSLWEYWNFKPAVFLRRLGCGGDTWLTLAAVEEAMWPWICKVISWGSGVPNSHIPVNMMKHPLCTR